MILITRPHHLAHSTAQALKDVGLESVIIPVLNVEYLIKDLVYDQYNAIIITSQNAVLSCHHIDGLKEKRIYAVGKSTKRLLQQYGFRNIIFNEDECGNLEKLLSYIERMEPAGSSLLFLSGDYITKDISVCSQLLSYTVKREIVYRTQIVTELSSESCELIQNIVTTILLYSTRSAFAFAQLARRYCFNLSKKNIVCISQSVKNQIEDIGCNNIYIASDPCDFVCNSLAFVSQ